MSEELAIRAVGVTKKYRSGDHDLVVFADLNLEVAQGEKLALIGESGAGKSTLMHLLGGLDRVTEGAIYFGQNDICKLSGDQLSEFRNRELGYVWQIQSLLAEFTAIENVMMPLLIRGQSRDQAEPVSMARLEEVGLRTGRRIVPGSFQAANNSAWFWPEPSPATPACSWPTSPPAASITGQEK